GPRPMGFPKGRSGSSSLWSNTGLQTPCSINLIAFRCQVVSRFPGKKRFAFAVFDDTDYGTVENTGLVYRFLLDLGMRTTKSVWPLSRVSDARIGGSTLQDKDYLEFIRWLQREGFEIALHNVRNHDAPRRLVEQGFQEFQELLGMSPRIHCNHSMNRENIYWGSRRLETPVIRLAYNIATRFARNGYFQGDVRHSPYFWGDICKERISYVRNLVFDEINLDRVNPTMPYHDPAKPFVNFWFSSSEGGTVESFCKMLCEPNQDRLEAEGGVCVVYTHFGKGFCLGRHLHPEFERLMRRLAKMNGWFVPVATLLDHLREGSKGSVISPPERRRMEMRWFLSKLRSGTS
ncbi:MAG: hypothetical protein ACE5JU_17215, partial [Candidatus Binatia bacterium]